jgi:hypothetical protein
LPFTEADVSLRLILKRPNKKTAAAPTAPVRRTALSKVLLVAGGMALMLLLESLFWPNRGTSSRHDALSGTVHAGVAQTNLPPWGRLEYVPIALDRPEEYFTNDYARSPKPIWVFRNHSEQQLLALFGTLDLTKSARAWLTDRAHWETIPTGIRIAPSPEVVLSLSATTRGQLYPLLGRSPDNYPQFTPFRFRADGFDDWFADCGLAKEKLSTVRQLAYSHDGTLCFADAATFAQVSTPEETKCLIKSLWRVSTFVLKLRVNPQTDVDSLMKYWGTLSAARNYRPLVESMTRVPEGATINVSYLLPPFARLRLYTYPNPADTNILREDCFWSSMNFFNHSPDNGFFDPDYTRKVLASDYSRVRDGSRQPGDMLMLRSKEGMALHMCVYIVDDVVFTKNGANIQQPWVLMKLSEMLSSYEKDKPYEIFTYRRNTPPPLGSALEYSSVANSL